MSCLVRDPRRYSSSGRIICCPLLLRGEVDTGDGRCVFIYNRGKRGLEVASFLPSFLLSTVGSGPFTPLLLLGSIVPLCRDNSCLLHDQGLAIPTEEGSPAGGHLIMFAPVGGLTSSKPRGF